MTTSHRPPLRLAAIGIDHGHVFDHVRGLTAAGAEFVGYCPDSTVPGLVEQLARAYPDARPQPRQALLDDPQIDIISICAVPSQRAGLAMQAMRAGKDTIVDKPGVTTFEQLEAVQRTVRETGRIYSVCFSERLCVPSAVHAGERVAAGEIGRVIQTIGLGPHRKGRARPDWFWRMEDVGGILVDIASHQIDQFLHYTGAATAEVQASAVGNFGTPEHPRFEDYGEVLLHAPQGRGYVRVDWFTPDGLPTWGDGRLTILGTEGYIELRKYIDIAGRSGGNHLFISNRDGTRHIPCEGLPLPYFAALARDVHERTETAMSQRHVFEVCRLSLQAQQQARRLGALEAAA
ncbi:MAG: Gfo/Idh/MocA family oxidoreductase [Rubrivivax sp.]|jgi:predicted dehydrogenase|nr:Gfo/Idh/MocA family oxidoreductase [Rubrivivax sp.]